MNRRGIVGIAVLWIVTALSAVAFAALSIGRWQAARGRTAVEQTRALYLVKGAALLARDAGFEFTERAFPFSMGTVQTRRDGAPDKQALTLACDVHAGPVDRRIEIGWRRIGGDWRADSWKEL